MAGFVSNLSLRNRAVIGFVLVSSVLFSLIYSYSSSVILKEFLKIEENEAATNLSRIDDAIKGEKDAYVNSLVGYAQWDDAYQYVKVKKDPVFEKSNLGITLATLKIDYFGYWDSDKKIVFDTRLDLKTEDEAKILFPMEKQDQQLLASMDELHQMKDLLKFTTLFLELSDGPHMIFSIPMSTSDSKSPANGVLLASKKLDTDYFLHVEEKLHVKIKSNNLQSQASDTYKDVIKALSSEPYYINRENSNELHSFKLIKDHNLKNLILIEMTTPRDIYLQSQSTMLTFLKTIILSTIVLVITLFFLINRLVLSRIFKLSSVMQNIIKTGNLKEKVGELGNDEIGDLGAYFNSMIHEIDKLKANAIYNEKMVSLGEMSGGIAHEINNPISVINVSANLMRLMHQKGVKEPEIYIKQIDVITETVARISNIITGLKNISRDTESETFSVSILKEIIEDSLGVCREKFKANGIRLDVNLADPVYQVKINCLRVQLSQVLINLLMNSFDAIAKLEKPWVEISASVLPNGLLALRVQDSGGGIPEEVQKKIFQPFFTTKEVGKGTGLGLSIGNSIIQRHNGTLTIDNSCKNTCFVITLPIKENK